MALSPEVAFEQHRERLLSVIYLRMGPALRARMDPEDVLQEVAIEAVNSWHTLAEEGSAGAWLVTLARRKVGRIIRDQISVAARDPRKEVAPKTDLPIADRRSGPVTHADRKDRLQLLAAAMEKLSEDHREVLMMMQIEGRSAREVAEHMGRTENAVYLLASRALEKLRRELMP